MEPLVALLRTSLTEGRRICKEAREKSCVFAKICELLNGESRFAVDNADSNANVECVGDYWIFVMQTVFRSSRRLEVE